MSESTTPQHFVIARTRAPSCPVCLGGGALPSMRTAGETVPCPRCLLGPETATEDDRALVSFLSVLAAAAVIAAVIVGLVMRGAA